MADLSKQADDGLDNRLEIVEVYLVEASNFSRSEDLASTVDHFCADVATFAARWSHPGHRKLFLCLSLLSSLHE